jgi:hypothetical protein
MSDRLKIPGLGTPVTLSNPINGAKYFTWAEALKNGTRVPANWTITRNIIAAAKRFDVARDALREPMFVTSWYRDPASNAAAGGVSNSVHLSGGAIDFYCDGMSSSEAYDILHPIWEGGLGYYVMHLHLDVGAYARF